MAGRAAAHAACGGSGKHSRQPTTTTLANRKTRALTIGSVDIESAGPPVQLSKKQKQSLLAAAQQYVDDAVYAPLNTGTVSATYPSLFDPSVRAAATSTDLSALAANRISVTPLRLDRTDQAFMTTLAEALD